MPFRTPLINLTLCVSLCASVQAHDQRTERQFFQQPEMAALNLPFSDAVLVGDALYLSGNGGVDPATETQKRFSRELRRRKLGHIEASRPDLIVTADIGCQNHLQEATEITVRHWLEVLAQGMQSQEGVDGARPVGSS